MRIVSLLPSTTEILFALGLGDDVVGVTFECDYPPEARVRRIVSTSTLPAGLSLAEIDAAVSERKAAGEDLYHLDEGALAELDADLIVTQDLCAVCAANVSTVHQALRHLGSSAEVLTINPHTLSEVLKSIVTVGDATGATATAEELVTALSRRLDTVRQRVDGHRRVPTMVLEWTDPPYAPGHWVPDMISEAGGRPVLGTAGQPSFATTWCEVAAAGPEAIVSAPCGFDLDEAAQHTAEARDRGVLPAGTPMWAVDANAAFARPGPRLVDGVEAMAAILHPDVFGEPDPAVARRVA
ncbi:cobalamin-binding protein [Haloechinothrix sp. LS1_15]|uniref:cobalamin-binding protein n=1 Tax=Haloechinothrix sp. LS1_15 TaxID=2652248 RepID=UPI002945B119|nr:cobalamin-binding protein [Haloechinothrix sp. LS1_15]MDV6012330.1 cobalamin-binding protein [Haloechinothrix sp. LS1_15]